MGLSDFLGFGSAITNPTIELPDIFPFDYRLDEFVKIDVESIYKKILTDVVERTSGITDENEKALWDNFLESEASKGLISLLAEAMFKNGDLFLTYKQGVLRVADHEEVEKIKQEYASGTPTTGFYFNFKFFKVNTMIKMYSTNDYYALSALHKKNCISKAIQLKIANLRQSIAEGDATPILAQARAIAQGLKEGKDVALDGGDKIETGSPEMESTKQAIEFNDAKKAFYLGLPLSYVTGEQTAGMNATGEVDARAVERGLKNYYRSILKPAVETIFNIKTTFKSDDFRLLTQAFEALKTFELADLDNVYFDSDEKRDIVRKLFNAEY
jgi:hypothetical protein